MSDDDDFSTLKPSLRRAIDTAFFKLVKKSNEARKEEVPRKRRRVELDDADGGGGFVKSGGDEDEGDQGAQKITQLVHLHTYSYPLTLQLPTMTKTQAYPSRSFHQVSRYILPSHASPSPTHIPSLNKMLDLPPDDQEVLTVFRNAASGWENPRPRRPKPGSDDDKMEVEEDKDAGLSVSKEDWRAVCAVLLGQQQEESEQPSLKKQPGTRPSRRKASPATSDRRQTRASTRKGKAKAPEPEPDSDEGGGFMFEDENNEGSGFVFEDDDEGGGGFELDDEEDEVGSDSDRYSEQSGDEDSGSEFGASAGPSRTTRGTTKQKDEEDEDGSELEMDADNEMPQTLTARQEREARLAFALFFPDMDPNDLTLDQKKIGIREVGDAAKTLKEKLLTDDIIEMLSMFSSGPGGTVGLAEFGRMAVMARLV
ncbi:hypothetical protein FRC12_015826 [Ceratobasidium sp. 428]|nr:hypothetical protein FRC12_015826 [Ceratobasidium sp. 428]